ncbi:MAG: polysaccharide biosynthesis tyrosine autokinase [Bacteroidales bacterium]
MGNNNNIDIKSIIIKFLKYKWIIIVCIVIALMIVYVYNKLSPNIYQNSTQLLIDIDETSPHRAVNERFQAMNVGGETSSLENELGKMRSFPVVKNTLTQLNMEISYHIRENPFNIKPLTKLPYYTTRELYKDSPFRVNFYRSHDQPINTKFYVKILTDSTFHMELREDDVSIFNYIDNKTKKQIKRLSIDNTFSFGEEIETPHYKFYITLADSTISPEENSEKMFFMFHHTDYLTLYYLNNLNIQPVSPTSSLIDISITGNNYRKITDFLNHLAQVYINKDLEEKNREAISTIEFIESQISDVASSLSYTGSTLEEFRSQHRIVDLDFQGQMMYETLSRLESEKASMVTQKRYYTQIKNYIENNQVSELMAPSSMNINEPILNSLITRLLETNEERSSDAVRSQKNVYREELNKNIENLKRTILENVNTSLKNIDISLEDLDYRINKISSDLSGLPATEMKLQSIQRRFELNDEIYTYLLTKRAEAQIAQASNFPSYSIVDPARNLDYSIIAPRKRLNYLLGIIVGLILPVSVILFNDFFNTKIRTISDLESITNIPLLGVIIHRKKSENGQIKKSFSPTSESIRMLRTNLQILEGKENHVILVTSSTSAEGKTFTANNLAQSFSLLQKRTILVGYDLRKPKLATLQNLSNTKGVSTYLANKHDIKELIKHTENNYLDIITEGPLPPNPTELISSPKTHTLIQYLKSYYDFIIIDTSPVGIVPDSKLIMKYSDINILLVRQNKTLKNELINTLKYLDNSKIANFYMVMNDFTSKDDHYNSTYKYYFEKT